MNAQEKKNKKKQSRVEGIYLLYRSQGLPDFFIAQSKDVQELLLVLGFHDHLIKHDPPRHGRHQLRYVTLVKLDLTVTGLFNQFFYFSFWFSDNKHVFIVVVDECC